MVEKLKHYTLDVLNIDKGSAAVAADGQCLYN